MSNIKEEIVKHLELEDLTGDTRLIAELADMEVVKKLLLSECAGMRLTIQQIRYCDAAVLRYLNDKFPAKNYTKKELLKISKELDRPYNHLVKLLKDN
jgi:hypothetical protein